MLTGVPDTDGGVDPDPDLEIPRSGSDRQENPGSGYESQIHPFHILFLK